MVNKIKVFFCDSCECYKTDDDAEYCKSLKHTIYPGIAKLKNELKIEYQKLKKNSGNTLEKKQEAKDRINELQEIAGFPLTDWEEPDNEIDSSLIKKLYDYLQSNINGLVISKDDSAQIYARIDTGSHVEILNLNSSRAISWLMFNHKRMTNEFYGESVYKNALEHIKADAIHNESPAQSIYNRISQVKRKNNETTIYYDLLDPNWSFVRITKQGYVIISYTDSFPVFERFRGNSEQVMPNELSKKEDPLEELCDLFKIKDKVLFKVHLIHFFFQDQETPFMFFDGEHGSVKTTITQMVKRTVDPTSSNIGSFSMDKKELQANISNKYLAAYDNVSGFDHIVSDMLCRALSGDEISKRSLYSNNDLFVKSYSKKKFVFNGISPSIDFPDFNDRTLYYKTFHITKDQKMSKSDLWTKHDELLPHVLHQIFNTISKTLAVYDDIGAKIKSESRLGDFEKYGETISQMLGYKKNEFLDAYYLKRDEISVKDNDSWPIIRVIDTFIKSKPENERTFEGLTSTLYKDLTNMAMSHFSLDIKDKYSNWPKKAHFLSQHINKLKEQFRMSGYDIDVGVYTKRDPPEWHNRSVTTIKTMEIKVRQNHHDQPDHPNQPDNQAQIDDNFGRTDGRGDGNGRADIDNMDEPNHIPRPKNEDSSHENDNGQAGRGGRADSDNSSDYENDELYTHWACVICHQDNPELFELEKSDKDNKSIEDHRRAGHEVKQFTQTQAMEFL